MALDLYKCETLLPEGSADVLVEGYQQGDVIEMDFLNNALGRVIEGSFVINFVDKKNGKFHASGVFTDGRDQFEGFLQGRLISNEGRVHFAIHANWDHRIEFGYGNFAVCDLD